MPGRSAVGDRSPTTARRSTGAPVLALALDQVAAQRARQAVLEQQALLESWQRMQIQLAERWREQVEEAMRAFDRLAVAASPSGA